MKTWPSSLEEEPGLRRARRPSPPRRGVLATTAVSSGQRDISVAAFHAQHYEDGGFHEGSSRSATQQKLYIPGTHLLSKRRARELLPP